MMVSVVMVVSREDTVDMSVVVMVVSREDWRLRLPPASQSANTTVCCTINLNLITKLLLSFSLVNILRITRVSFNEKKILSPAIYNIPSNGE